MKTISLTQGLVALIDDADYEAVTQFKWYALKSGGGFYAVRNINRADGSRTLLYLHQFLMPGVPEIDHKDGNRLNNQRANLRSVTRTQNLQGFQEKRVGTSSSYRGVRRVGNKWYAKVNAGGKPMHLGSFISETEAARAYDAAALKYYGDFASQNFPV